MYRIKGLELLFNLVKNEIKSKEDCLVVALHSLFITNEELNVKCVGVGEQFGEEDSLVESELLPEAWNANQEVYALRYLNKDHSKRYLVKIVETGNMLLCNVVLNEKTVATMATNASDFISEDWGQFSSTYKNLKPLSETFDRDIVQFLQNANSSSNSEKQEEQEKPIKKKHEERTNDKRRETSPPARPSPQVDPYGNWPNNPPPVGDRDLDPLGRGYGGMLMDPRDFRLPRPDMPPTGPHGLPPGALPPGARFDPFRPPIGGPFGRNPDSDDRRPPGYDDMFM